MFGLIGRTSSQASGQFSIGRSSSFFASEAQASGLNLAMAKDLPSPNIFRSLLSPDFVAHRASESFRQFDEPRSWPLWSLIGKCVLVSYSERSLTCFFFSCLSLSITVLCSPTGFGDTELGSGDACL